MSNPCIEYYNAAIDAIQMGQLDKALTAVEHALMENAKDPESWQLYINLLTTLGLTADAANATAKLKEIGISEVDELLLQAAHAMSQGDLNLAITHYESALELKCDQSHIYSSYALLLMEAKREKEARSAAETAVCLDPKDAKSSYALGRILRLQGEPKAALEALSNAVKLEPQLLLAVYEQGMVLADCNRCEEALTCFEKFLLQQPDDENAQKAIQQIREKTRPQVS